MYGFISTEIRKLKEFSDSSTLVLFKNKKSKSCKEEFRLYICNIKAIKTKVALGNELFIQVAHKLRQYFKVYYFGTLSYDNDV